MDSKYSKLGLSVNVHALELQTGLSTSEFTVITPSLQVRWAAGR